MQYAMGRNQGNVLCCVLQAHSWCRGNSNTCTPLCRIHLIPDMGLNRFADISKFFRPVLCIHNFGEVIIQFVYENSVSRIPVIFWWSFSKFVKLKEGRTVDVYTFSQLFHTCLSFLMSWDEQGFYKKDLFPPPN